MANSQTLVPDAPPSLSSETKPDLSVPSFPQELPYSETPPQAFLEALARSFDGSEIGGVPSRTHQAVELIIWSAYAAAIFGVLGLIWAVGNALSRLLPH